MDRSITVYPGAAETYPCKYGEPLPDLPTNFLLAAPTASGKTQAILSLCLKFYLNALARIWIFCPSIKLDPTYKPLRDYLEKMCDQSKEPLMFEEMDHALLGRILDEQREIVEACRKRKVKAPQVLLILDDLGDQGDVLASRRGGKSGGSWLTTLACRSRHLCLTWICSVQKLNQAGLTIRANTRCMCVWRLRNHKEIEILAEEMSGFYPKDVIMDLYTHATSEPFSFLFVRLDAKTRRDAFWLRFESRLVPETSEDDKDGSGPVGRSARQPVAQQRPEPAAVRSEGNDLPSAGTAGKALKRNPGWASLRTQPRNVPGHQTKKA